MLIEMLFQKCDWCGDEYIPQRRRKFNAAHVFCCRKHKENHSNSFKVVGGYTVKRKSKKISSAEKHTIIRHD